VNSSILRLGFAGTPALAATILEHLLEHTGHQIKIVYTQPDRPAGRGRNITPGPVKALAQKYGLPLAQPDMPSAFDQEGRLEELDALIVAAYGMLLPAEVLKRPRYGCINVHTSLLPRWRGAAPIQRAIESGDTETGVTIMQMDAGLDTGAILSRMRCPISPHDTSATLREKLAVLGAQCLQQTLTDIISGKISPQLQDARLATYANKISKAEARLDWSRPAVELERRIRAFNPAPVAYAGFAGTPVRIWEARVIDHNINAQPGTVIRNDHEGVDIVTGKGILRLIKIQPPGKRCMDIRDFLRGRPGFFDQTAASP
jgi:methionyl-tRNA formyltransferase